VRGTCVVAWLAVGAGRPRRRRRFDLAATVSRSRVAIWRPHARRLATLPTNGHQHSPSGCQPPNVLSDVVRRAIPSFPAQRSVRGKGGDRLKHLGKTRPFRGPDGRVVRGSIAEVNYLRLGGVDQWVLIRGESLTNPPLILLHGWPGFSETHFFRRSMRRWRGSSRSSTGTSAAAVSHSTGRLAGPP
jgi:hypothetical protein